MFLIVFAALIAAGETAKLDRTYLPPISAATAGGGPGSLQLPFSKSNEGAPGNQDIPTGGFVNNHQGVVVEAALAGTRASGPQSALGGPRISYGSSDSKVGDAAFRVTNNRFPQGPANGLGPNEEPDLSAFHRPSSFKPGNIQIIRDYVSNTVKYQNNVGLDKFNYAFETDNGIKMSENGVSRNGIQAQGGYSYTGDDGKVYSVVYTADKNGYRPTGNHLPTPPPIPAEILESLKQNARDEAAGLVDDGSYDAKKYNTEDNYAENETNDKYNDRQSNKFGDRPAFAGGFINQNQQAFVAPSFNGQFGVNDASKETTFSKPDLSKFDSLVQSDNRFGSIREPSKDNANNFLSNQQIENQLTSTSINAANANMEVKPLSQQKLQVQQPFEKPSFNRPSSYDTSNLGLLSSSAGSSQPSYVTSFSQMNQGAANNFGNGNNRFSGQAFLYQLTPGSFNLNANQGLPIEQSYNHNKPFSVQNSLSTLTSSQPSTGYFTTQPTQQFPSANIQSSQNGRLSGSKFSSSPFSASSNSISENSNQPVFTTPLKPSFPTKKPLTILTTPLESFDVTNEGGSFSQSDMNKKEDLDNKKLPTTSKEFTTSLSQSTHNIEGDSSTRYTDKPSFISLDNRFSGTQTTQSPDSSQFIQPQGPDRSYVYNRPSKPFNTPFVGTGSISSSNPNSQVTSLLPQSSFFTNIPQTSISSMKNGAVIGSQSANLSRVTQAPLTFPSRVSGVSTELNTKPSFNTQSASTFSQIIPTAMTATAQIFSIPSSEKISSQGIQQHQDGNTSSPSQQNTEVYQYPKPAVVLPSQAEKQNLQSSQGNSASKDSFFPQLNVFSTQKPTTQSSFNLKPHSQFFQDAFNNNGPNVPLFPKFDQQNAPQVDSDKTQNQATGFNSQPQFGQQNIPTFPKKPEQSFESLSRPQPQEIGLFGDKGQLNLSSAALFGSKPFISASSFSQGTSSGLNTPSILSQTEQETSYKPTEESTTQNTQSVLNNKELTSAQQQESVQSSFFDFNKFETSQFSSLMSKFGNKPISVGTQFGTFNIQNKLSDISGQSSFTSKKPFSQTSPIHLQESTQLNENTLSKEETTTYEQAGDSLDDKHTTLLPSSTQFQTGSFDTQRPTTQFGQSSFSITSLKPSSQSQFGSQQGIPIFEQGNFNDKESTPSQFDQSTQQFGTDLNNKLSSQIPSSSQVQYNDYNKETTNTQFSVPSSFDQFFSRNQPSQLSTVFAAPLGKDNESITTTNIQFDNKQTMTSNEPSNLISSTFEIQAPTQSSEFGQIYDYKKPVQGLLTTSQEQDRPQFQANMQFDQQGLLNIQKGKPAQFTQPLFNSPSSISIANEDKVESVTQQNSLGTFLSTQDGTFSTSQNSDQNSGEIYEYNKPSTQFGQQSIFNVQKEKPAQFTKPLFNSQFTTNEDKAETATQENILTGIPSTPEVLPSTLQNGAQNNGLIYEYNKPNKQFGQQLSISTQKEKPTQFSQASFNFASTQFSAIDDKSESVTQENILTGMPSTQPFSSTSDNSDQSAGEIYEYNKSEQSLSTSSENDGATQFGQKIQSTPNVNREDFFTNQQTHNIQNKNTDEQTSGEINEQPRPQLAFHSACCGGVFKRPLGSNNLNPSFNILNQNKDSVSNQKPSQGDQSIDEQNKEPHKASSFTGVGEEFPSSRNPPSFDENGYHY